MIRKCSWCGAKLGEIPPYENKGVTHGICPDCLVKHFPKVAREIMTTNTSELGKILKRQRLMIPLTLHELAAKSGVSPSHLGRIERGNRFPSAHILQKLAEPLGFDEGELFARAGYLSPKAEREYIQGVDPYVTAVLSQEPVEMQRTVVGILSVLKSVAQGYSKVSWPEFAEYARRKYPELDEDVITMIEDLIKHPPRAKKDE